HGTLEARHIYKTAHTPQNTGKHTHTHMCVYLYVCVCVQISPTPYYTFCYDTDGEADKSQRHFISTRPLISLNQSRMPKPKTVSITPSDWSDSYSNVMGWR